MRNLTRFFAMVHKQSIIFFNEKLKNLDVKRGHSMYIMCIGENPGLSQDQIAALLGVDKSAVTNAVQNMLKLDYVVRAVNADDKRANTVSLTPRGIDIYETIMKVSKEFDAFITQKMTDVERDIFDRILDRVYLPNVTLKELNPKRVAEEVLKED